MTLIEKILQGRSGEERQIEWNWFFLNDITADKVLPQINPEEIESTNLQKMLLFVDHVVPSDSEETDQIQTMMRNFSNKHGVPFWEGKGIGYPLAINNLLVPGQTVCAMGTHACTMGASGALVLKVSSETFKASLVGEPYCVRVPNTLRIELQGNLHSGVNARDAAFELVNRFNKKDLSNTVLQIGGSGLETFNLSQITAFCNTLSVLNPWTILVEAGLGVDVVYEDYQEVVFLELDSVDPVIVGPYDFRRVLIPENSVAETIQSAFVGGCSGGSIEDIRIVASMLKGKRVAKYMRFLVVPNTQSCYLQALNEGLVDIIVDSGAMIMNPHCSTCYGKSQGYIASGEAMIITGICDCKGHASPPDGKVYLGSVETVTRCALSGKLC